MLHNAHSSCLCAPVEKGRNLVVCIDGTSYHLGLDTDRSSNVLRFFCHLDPVDQLKYYKNGIGASDGHLHSPTKIIGNAIDLAVAWHIDQGITEAYSWLSEKYKPGDRIFLLGYSRGAYQVRALAAMIETVGLLPAGNKEHIPRAYDLYAGSHAAARAAASFKARMAMPSVSVHFVGVWDTVCSVGLVSHTRLPLSKGCEHICTFRHALALDEQRVKFEPECAFDDGRLPSRDAKEVWFAGSHSDIGGGEGLPEDTLNIETVPLQWMEHEAFMAGLHFNSPQYIWNVSELLKATPHKSLHGAWRLLEVMPVKRQKQTNTNEASRKPHHGKGRAIYPGQKIHASVAFMDKSYKPKAAFKHATTLDWGDVVGHGVPGQSLRHADWAARLELDIFDLNAVPEWIDILRRNDIFSGHALRIITRLDFMSSLQGGDKALAGVPDAATVFQQRLSIQEPEVYFAAAKLLAKLAVTGDSTASGLLKAMGMQDKATMLGNNIPAVTRIESSEYADSPPSYVADWRVDYRRRVQSSVSMVAVAV